MSATPEHPSFENRLSDLPRRGLPDEFREEILANACGERRVPPFSRAWRALRKPALGALAAAWVAIGVMQFTRPEAEQAVAHHSVPAGEEHMAPANEPSRLLAAWIEYRRSLEKL